MFMRVAETDAGGRFVLHTRARGDLSIGGRGSDVQHLADVAAVRDAGEAHSLTGGAAHVGGCRAD